MSELATLGTTDGPGLLPGMPASVSADAHGGYWLLAYGEMPMLFDRAGRFVRSVGRKGQGPGEFQQVIEAIPLPGDSTLVLDAGAHRVTVLAQDLRAVRFVSLPLPLWRLVVIEWPKLVMADGTGSSYGWTLPPLHRVSLAEPEARVLGSFGPGLSESKSRSSSELAQRLAASRDGSLWSADVNVYRLHNWRRDGAPIRAIVRTPSWFAERTSSILGGPNKPPAPSIEAIREDSAGLIWVYTHIAAPTWREGWVNVRPGQKEIRSTSVRFDKLFHTTLEVIDPRAARVVARVTIESDVVAALPGERAAVYTVGPDDIPRVKILKLTLTGR